MLLLLFLTFCSTVVKDGHAQDQNIRLKGGILGPGGPRSIGNMQQPSLVRLPPPNNGQAPIYVYCYPAKSVVNAYTKDTVLKTNEPRYKTKSGSSQSPPQRQPWLVLSASSEDRFPRVILSGGIVKSLETAMNTARYNFPVDGQPSVSKPPPIGQPNYPSGQHDVSGSSPSPVPSSPSRHQYGRPYNVVLPAPYHLLPGGGLPRVGQNLSPPPGFGSQSAEGMKRQPNWPKNVYSLNAADESFRPYARTNPFGAPRSSISCGGKTDKFGKCDDKEIKKEKEKEKKEKKEEKRKEKGGKKEKNE